MNNLKKFALLLMVPLAFACSKDEEGGAEADLAGDWTYESATIDLKINGENFIDYYKDELEATQEEAEEAEEFFIEAFSFFQGLKITFKSDGTYTTIFDGEEDTGTWSLNSDATILTLDAGTAESSAMKVYTLTSSKFTFGMDEEEVEDLNSDGVDETLSIAMRVNMKK
ncbi:lipocalin-like domain-containing protein [Marinoscillum sp.]|uniref:lipocalin-like domain-containing protein n=1 Tax=Marinoscillum sp. TaxID=2024838 RepID=UPI003BA933C0